MPLLVVPRRTTPWPPRGPKALVKKLWVSQDINGVDQDRDAGQEM